MDPVTADAPESVNEFPYSAFVELGQIDIQHEILCVTVQMISVPAGSSQDDLDGALTGARWERICPWKKTDAGEELARFVMPLGRDA